MKLNFNFNRILWIGLVASLVMSYSGAVLRITNERNNKAVIPVIDYKDFYKASNETGQDIARILERFKENGVENVAIRETTLSDLHYGGKALVTTLGEYLSRLQGDTSEESTDMREVLLDTNLKPSNAVVICSDRDTIALLDDGLKNRLGADNLIKFEFGGKAFYYIDSSLEQALDMGTGFEEDTLEELSEAGLELVLRPRNSPSPSVWQIEEYKELLKKYKIKYVIFDGSELAGYPLDMDVLFDIFKENGIITGIIEAPSQVRYVEQKGLEELIQSTDFAINRVYINPPKDMEKLTGSDLYHRWIRCVVDRSIRFVYIQPLANPRLDAQRNIEETYDAVHSLNNFLSSKGYALNKDLAVLSDKMPSKLHEASTLLSVLLVLVLYLGYFFGQRKIYIAVFTVLAVIGGGAAVTVLGFNLQQLIAVAAAVMYPSLAGILILKYLKESGEKPFLKNITALLVIMLGVSLTGAYTVITTLSDIRYTMNTEVYKGVVLSFFIPLGLFALSYFACFECLEGLGGRLMGFLNRRVSYLHALIIFAGIFAIVLYLARSGNDSGIAASAIELKIRNLLEETMVARPRFKEFLAGYPALFLSAFFYQKFKKHIILLPLGIGVVMGSVSIVNSFCHVFTAVEVSLKRTVNGLTLGVVTGLAALAAAKLAVLIYDKYKTKLLG